MRPFEDLTIHNFLKYPCRGHLNIDANDGNTFVKYSIAPNTILDDGAMCVFEGYQVTEKIIELEVPENP
ncbi:MAG: hypothetical protein WBG48_11150 [Pricia sp.]